VVIAFIRTTLEDEFLQEEGRRLYLTTEQARFVMPTDDTVPADTMERFRSDPFFPLYVQLVENDEVDPQEECASLREFLEAEGVRERFTQTKPKLKNEDEWDTIWLSVSMPAVSQDGREAIMLSGLTFGPLAGGGSEVYLRRSRQGEWVIKYEKSTWIS